MVLSGVLQEIITNFTNTHGAGTGMSLGVALPDSLSLFPGAPGKQGVISLSAGDRHRQRDTALVDVCKFPTPVRHPACVAPADAFAMGSTAKMYTAAAVLRLVEQGKFGLDDKVLPLFDDLWTKLSGSSIVNGLGPQIRNVTVRHLLGMQSGIPDFDNDASRQYQFEYPHKDLGPVEEMSFLFPLKSFWFEPGTSARYSSSNYELLGLILAQQSGKGSWDEYTQAEGLPSFPEMTSTAFAVHGPCSDYTKVHAYSNERNPSVDVYNVSCTNGWTCGNLISNAADAAFFVRALLGKGERVVKDSTQKEMLKTRPFDKNGWAPGLPYGLGVMDFSVFFKGKEPGELIGHGGATYGFNAYTIYSRKWDFGMSVVVNNENTETTAKAIGEAYDAVVYYLNNTRPALMIV
jgi:D-alanyl-D-alanine carboxypeptidase